MRYITMAVFLALIFLQLIKFPSQIFGWTDVTASTNSKAPTCTLYSYPAPHKTTMCSAPVVNDYSKGT